MTRLSSNDLTRLLDLVHEAHAIREAGQLGGHLATRLHGLIGADLSTYSDITPHRRDTIELTIPDGVFTPRSNEAYRRYMHEHPLLSHHTRTGDGGAFKLSDFATRTQIHRLALYNEWARPYTATQHSMAMAFVATRSHLVGVALSRSSRDFSERERLILNLLRPHIVQARRNIAALDRYAGQIEGLSRGVDGLAVGIALVDHGGRTRLTTARAREWMRRYFGRSQPSERLPEPLRRWLRARARAWTGRDDAPPPLPPLLAQRDGRRLVVRHVPDPTGCLLLFEEQRTHIEPAVLRRLGLTPREADVLAWVAAGKTNDETATIVGIRPRTVEKHLERIYLKLGVENRTAAAACVHALQREPPSQ